MKIPCRSLTWLSLCLMAAACSRDPEVLQQQHMKTGDQYFEQGQYEQAAIEYSNALKQNRQAGEVQFALAEAQMAAGNTRAAFPAYVGAADLMPDNLEAQIKAGHLLFKGGMFDEARNRARSVLQKDPNNVEALLLLGNTLAGLKDLDSAVGVLERAIQIDPERAGTYTNLGVIRFARGEAAEAEGTFKKAVAVSHESAEALVGLANFYRVAKRMDEAERTLAKAYAKDSRNLAANEALAGLYMDTGRAPRAEAHLQTVASISTEPDPKFALASYYTTVGRPAEAVTILESLAAEKDLFARATIRLALLDYGAGNRAQAGQRVDTVIAREPKNANALTLKARLLLADGNAEAAVPLVDAALLAEPKMTQALLTRGRIYLALERTEDARQSFARALDSDPSSLPALLELAELHLERRELDSALRYANLAATDHSDSLPARLMLVRTLLVRGEPVEQQVRALRTQFPDSPAVYTATASMALSRHNLQDARRAFEQGLKLNPRSMEAVTGLITIDLVNRRFSDAKGRVDALLTPRPSSARPYLLAATVYEMVGEPARVEQLLREALDVDPTNPDVYGRLGELYVSRGRIGDARKEFNELVRLQPRSVGALSISGLLAYMERDLPDAQKRWEEALRVDPKAAAAANNLAWLYTEIGGNLDIALQLAQTAKAQFPDLADVDDTIGWIQYKRGLTIVALNSLERAVEKRPKNPQFQYHLGMAYAERGEDGKARVAFERALAISRSFDGADEARKTLAGLAY